MANIVSIGTAVPQYRHKQQDILQFMQQAYGLDNMESRKLAYLYKHSDIDERYSVIEDFSREKREWEFISQNGHDRTLEDRMHLYDSHAVPLSVKAIEECIHGVIKPHQITHLVTVSCTGMSAPGLDLQIAEVMELAPNLFRTSVNFMGCYAAIHGLKMAKMICDSTPGAKVVVVCTEICTIHFQKKYTLDNASSSLLFSDGSAAVLVSNDVASDNALRIRGFYSEVSYKGKGDMSWQLGSSGFLMRLSAYIPDLIQEDIQAFIRKAAEQEGLDVEDINRWCIHPGGKKILEVIQQQLGLSREDLACSREVLWKYGNMSSATILFVLKEIMKSLSKETANILGVAFGPGLTMESFIVSTV